MAPRMATVTYAFASVIASISARPRASPAAMAAEYVQPVPCVAGPSTRGAGKRIRAQVFQHGIDLASDELRRQIEHAQHAERVLRGDGGHGGHPEHLEGRERLEVGLDARSPAGIRPGDGEGLRNGHRPMQYTPP